MLAMPTLDGVPRSYRLQARSPFAISTACALMDAGYVDPMAPSRGDVSDIVRRGLAAWIDGHTRGMFPLFQFGVRFMEEQRHQHRVVLMLDWKPTAGAVLMHRRLAEIERVHPGLAETALAWLAEASAVTVPIFTPQAAFACIQARKYSRIPEAQFAHRIPRWVYNPRKALGRRQIEALANPHHTGRFGNFARAVLTVIGAHAENSKRLRYLRAPGATLWPPAFCLRWSANDVTSRVLDDQQHQHRYEPNTIACPFITAHPIEDAAKAAAGFAQFARGVEPMFPILRATGNLLTFIVRDGK